MGAVEEIQAAIDKLTALKGKSFPGKWEALGSGTANGDHWYVISAYESILSISANDGDDEAFREPTANLIATLHNTIDAQLSILHRGIETLDAREQLDDAYSWDDGQWAYSSSTQTVALSIARAINGVTP